MIQSLELLLAEAEESVNDDADADDDVTKKVDNVQNAGVIVVPVLIAVVAVI